MNGPDAAPKRLVPNPRANDGQADEPDFLLVEDREARQERAPGSPDSPAVASVPTQGDSAAPICGAPLSTLGGDEELLVCAMERGHDGSHGARCKTVSRSTGAPISDELRAEVEEDIYEEALVSLSHLDDDEEIDVRWLMPKPERVPADLETRMTMGEFRARIRSVRGG